MSQLEGTLSGMRVVVCAGAGGVGKTTVSAAVALGLAAAGERVAVVTIDPAHRLAEVLGLKELGNRPEPVDASGFEGAGLPVAGELSAMMLDVKRTFDELVDRLAPDVRTRDGILRNPIYEHLSSALAGSEEYTAMAKLFELSRADSHDVIVLDTPPSRSASAFLDAPQRLDEFLQSRIFGAFLGPTGTAARAAGTVFAVLRRLTGVALLDELTEFFQLLAHLLGGLRERARAVDELWSEATTAFLVITSTETAPRREAIRFGHELRRLGLNQAGVIVNRVQPLDPDARLASRTVERLAPRLRPGLAEKVARTHEEVQVLAQRDQAAVTELRTALGGPEPVCLGDRALGAPDAEMLVGLARELFGGVGSRTRSSPRGSP